MRSTRSSTTGRRTTTSTRTRYNSVSKAGWSPTQYGNVRDDIQWRIGSYRNIYSQVTGPSKITTFSPKKATQWANYVNSGCKVYKFNAPQMTRYFGSAWNNTQSATAVTRYLRHKYGTKNIKAVARGRGTTWLVATTGNFNRGPFKNYTWK
ncbi:MAG: hypothetical protein JXO22_18195 [Phycisphaerae bacterium]|nr:hypothetical protein [Phycisphaerae bacterium]